MDFLNAIVDDTVTASALSNAVMMTEANTLYRGLAKDVSV